MSQVLREKMQLEEQVHAQQTPLRSLRQGERPREREQIGRRSDDDSSKGDWEAAAQREKAGGGEAPTPKEEQGAGGKGGQRLGAAGQSGGRILTWPLDEGHCHFETQCQW